jgi:hypothetical protein
MFDSKINLGLLCAQFVRSMAPSRRKRLEEAIADYKLVCQLGSADMEKFYRIRAEEVAFSYVVGFVRSDKPRSAYVRAVANGEVSVSVIGDVGNAFSYDAKADALVYSNRSFYVWRYAVLGGFALVILFSIISCFPIFNGIDVSAVFSNLLRLFVGLFVLLGGVMVVAKCITYFIFSDGFRIGVAAGQEDRTKDDSQAEDQNQTKTKPETSGLGS